jgi:hypothetical protein
VAELTPRLAQRISADFTPDVAGTVTSYLEQLDQDSYSGQNHERVQAALVLAAGGDWDRFQAMYHLLRLDWRDVLVAGELAGDDWPQKLTGELGEP